jgi:hypothetical protein
MVFLRRPEQIVRWQIATEPCLRPTRQMSSADAQLNEHSDDAARTICFFL